MGVFKKCVDVAPGTWVSGEHGGGAGLMVGIGGLGGLLQPQQSCDSMICCSLG